MKKSPFQIDRQDALPSLEFICLFAGVSMLAWILCGSFWACISVLLSAIVAIVLNIVMRRRATIFGYVALYFAIYVIVSIPLVFLLPNEASYPYLSVFLVWFFRSDYVKKHQGAIVLNSRRAHTIIETLKKHVNKEKMQVSLSEFAIIPEDVSAARELERQGYIVIEEDIYKTVTITEAFIKEFVNAEPTENTQELPAEPSDPPTEQSDEEVKVTEPLEIKSTENSSDGDNNCVDTKKLTIITILLLSLFIFIVVLLNLPISRTNKSGKPSEPNQYRVTVSFELISNNHVGNDWEKIIYCRDREIGKKTIITADKDFYIGCYVIELDDKNDDSAKADFIFERSPIGKIETKSSQITVTEDAGQYAGNTAVWEVTVTVERLS